MGRDGVWVLVEKCGSTDRKVCTSDFMDTLQRVADRWREANPSRVLSVEPNVTKHTTTTEAEE